jgi:hypothetical protein
MPSTNAAYPPSSFPFLTLSLVFENTTFSWDLYLIQLKTDAATYHFVGLDFITVGIGEFLIPLEAASALFEFTVFKTHLLLGFS